ncbi:HNH endonuclease [Sphingomonas sanxanigenens]|uniref:Endonuclease n=1 Tax=Sphingomonas sanxanigenens DSM 19645 = NX02 TaxID=1123269 RepID=W0A5J0_9SPHN|nr:HNH endonuclease signature motif containing protein [Sphingomonas sanxanigenens]AHE51742.1 endonuclease [Sphingomonas sanxanigenens DSM 19645 = NX02]
MPSRPPKLNAKPRQAKPCNWSRRASRQARGYGREHERIRAELLRDEPLCRECAKAGRVNAAVIADHIVALALGGSGDRSNYQPLCRACSDAKTARESATARRRR